jgi:hypothetical protein
MCKATLTTAAVRGCPNRLLSGKAAVLRDSVKGAPYTILIYEHVIWVNTRITSGNSSIILLFFIPPLLGQT